jgi:hypothetical protein
MAELIRRKLEVPEPESELAEPDPLLAVAGLWSDGTLCENLDEELYDL